MIPRIRQLGFGCVVLSLAIAVPAMAQSQTPKAVEMAKRTLAEGEITYVKISETHRGRSTADEILKTL